MPPLNSFISSLTLKGNFSVSMNGYIIKKNNVDNDCTIAPPKTNIGVAKNANINVINGNHNWNIERAINFPSFVRTPIA